MAGGAGIGSIDELHETAAERTGHADFGGDDYREPMRILLDSYANEAGLTDAGDKRVRAQLLTALEARLRTQASLKDHPEYAEAQISRPIFVTGLPRTGTTALHRLLCVDPMHQGLEHWLTEAPQPRPPRETWPELPDFQRMQRFIDARHAADPDFKGLHFMAPDMVEECWRIKQQAMRTFSFEATSHIPTYSRWLAEQDQAPSYAIHRDVLRLVGLNDPDRRWALKSPSHLFGLDALMAAYPDALVIQTHRDPRTIVASVSSLNQRASAGASTVFHGAQLGEDSLDLWARGAGRFAEARARHDPGQFIDVRYEDFVHDAVQVVESIYDRFGLPLSESTHAAIEASHVESRVGERRPTHRYQLSDFGLAEEQVTERFVGYLREFFPEPAAHH